MWCDDWRRELEETDINMFDRLCECRNKKSDIIVMATLMAKYNKVHTAEECLDRMIEWVLIWNNQDYYDFEISDKEYKIMLKKVLTNVAL